MMKRRLVLIACGLLFPVSAMASGWWTTKPPKGPVAPTPAPVVTQFVSGDCFRWADGPCPPGNDTCLPCVYGVVNPDGVKKASYDVTYHCTDNGNTKGTALTFEDAVHYAKFACPAP